MRIGTNMSAIIANMNLNTANSKVSSSMQRLSSGYKINKASDDSVNRALSFKMKTQIKGLERATQNAADGISIVQTAEGALSEVQAMLQRMRELSVQGANDTNNPEDLAAINEEINALKKEINRIADDTVFNNTKLLDGSVSRRSYSNVNGVNMTYASSSVSAKEYGITILADPQKAEYISGAATTNTIAENQAGSIKINGEIIDIKAGETLGEVYEKVSILSDKLGIKVESSTPTYQNGSTLTFTTDNYGSESQINLKVDANLAAALGLNPQVNEKGVDISAEFSLDGGNRVGFTDLDMLKTDGTSITIIGRGGFELEFDIEPTLVADNGASVDVRENMLDIGNLTIQLGSREGQSLEININAINTKALKIDDINMSTSTGASRSISILDEAIKRVSEARANLGAYQNRLEYAISGVEVSKENMDSALSRIEDTNMAEEMTEYTSNNVVVQASISMLTHANQLPEKVLQLLQ